MLQVTESRSDLEDLHLYATPREQRFRMFASLEFEGQLYMTPHDFIQAVTSDEPKQKLIILDLNEICDGVNTSIVIDLPWKSCAKKWRSLSKQELNEILMETPPVWKGSSKLFRNLNEKEPHAGFRIAFNMFDTDGNEMVDKKEFLVLQEIFRKKNEKREKRGDEEKRAMLRADDISSSLSDTTLLVHFFGKKGKAELNFEDFYRFMDNLQTEVLEIEFLSYSNGMNTISEEDFAHILLRYTNVENTSSYLENMRCSIPEEKGITFEEFRSFFQFLNNLEDFTIAMQMYNFASRSIGQDEFKRAVYVATGVKLSPHLVNTVFKIFDVDRDDQLSYKEFIGIMKDRLNRGFRVQDFALAEFHKGPIGPFPQPVWVPLDGSPAHTSWCPKGGDCKLVTMTNIGEKDPVEQWVAQGLHRSAEKLQSDTVTDAILSNQIVVITVLYATSLCSDHFPGEPVPVPNHPLGEEPFSNIPPKPSLTQLQTIPSDPVTGHHREEVGACSLSSPHKKVVDCNEVSPQSPLLQAEQTK
ncbi:Calcium uptake protein 3, mitochondrial [Pitangus sulphuratus]|nr:Calcium uptake protein 3, mitochondrial [Pitangus sulphuratus]